METLKAIKARRSIRSFTDKDVSSDKILKIIEAGLRAPSSKNCQPWHFIILKGKEKDKVAEITEKNFDHPIWYDIKRSSVVESCAVVKQAPILILVFNKYPRSGGEAKAAKNSKLISAVIAETLSIGASIENMCLAATSLGLGTLWVGDLRNAKYFVEKHLKTKYDLIAGISVGYAKYKIPPKEIPKFDLNLSSKHQKRSMLNPLFPI